ncbi:MAG: hypothetical protein GXO49_00825, partial [Chlorobi bacterium]|nr:hypothetical protein [Chlorobiota bacterium]
FKNNILEFSSLPFKEQKEKHLKFLQNWKKNEEQIDDITFLGINWEY